MYGNKSSTETCAKKNARESRVTRISFGPTCALLRGFARMARNANRCSVCQVTDALEQLPCQVSRHARAQNSSKLFFFPKKRISKRRAFLDYKKVIFLTLCLVQIFMSNCKVQIIRKVDNN